MQKKEEARNLEIEKKIKEIFEENYETMRLDGGHALAADARQNALDQVLLYYQKLSEIAEKVTETEVKLSLPEQKTPKGRNFTIEGVVDNVNENEEVCMYDIKAHDLEYIRDNKELYERQLNIYRHIWQKVRGNKLDKTAIISTKIPNELRSAIKDGNLQAVDFFMKKWDPVVPIDVSEEGVQGTINEFAEVVDLIEDRKFSSPEVDTLFEKVFGTSTVFGSFVCRNCDARFSCKAFREYLMRSGVRDTDHFKKFFCDYGDQLDQEEFIESNLVGDEQKEGSETIGA